MSHSQNSADAAQTLQNHSQAENQAEIVVRTQRYQRAFNNARYVVAIIAALVLVTVIIKGLISGSTQEVEKLPGLLKQLLDLAPIRENPGWRNATLGL